jgi:hypothetical protein
VGTRILPAVADRGRLEACWPHRQDACVPIPIGFSDSVEAEWEKAARGADGRKYPWGNTPADHKRAQFAVRFNDTAPADAFPAGAKTPTTRRLRT